MAAFKCVVKKLSDGSLQFFPEGEWPELESGERVECLLALTTGETPALEAKNAKDAAAAAGAAAKAASKAAALKQK